MVKSNILAWIFEKSRNTKGNGSTRSELEVTIFDKNKSKSDGSLDDEGTAKANTMKENQKTKSSYQKEVGL